MIPPLGRAASGASGPNFQTAFDRLVLRADPGRHDLQRLGIGIDVVRRGSRPDPPVVDPAPSELVGVVDHLPVALGAERGHRLGRAADVAVDRVPFGGPGDEVVPGAADRAHVGRHLVLEDHHVARDAALRGCLPDDRCRVEAGLGPRCRRVVDHQRDRVLGGDPGRDQATGQGCRHQDGGRQRASGWGSATARA